MLKTTKTKFKDKCDECGKFDFLKGFNNKCLCEEKQLSIFDMEVLDNGKQRRNTGSTK